MQPEQPLLTIAIPTYNSARFLPDAIGSVLRQGMDNFEILVVDNASEDDTEAVVCALGLPQLRYIRNSSNYGSRQNINICLENSRGLYVKLLCADDVLSDGILIKQITLLERHPEVALVTCDFTVTDENLEAQYIERMFPGICRGDKVTNLCLSNMRNYFGGPSNFMFRRAEAERIRFDPSYKFVSDLKFAIQLVSGRSYANIGGSGYLYRRHAQADTAISCPVEIHMAEFMRLVNEFNWQNPLNCLQVLRCGNLENRQMMARYWIRACSLARIMKAIKAASDVLIARRYGKCG